MIPPLGGHSEDEDEFSDDNDDLKDDIEDLRRACFITGTNLDDLQITPPSPPSPHPSLNDADSSGRPVAPSSSAMYDSDDVNGDREFLRDIKARFSVNSEVPHSLKPSSSIYPPFSDEDEDDFETLCAIRRRFSAYEKNNLEEGVVEKAKKPEGVNTSSPCHEDETAIVAYTCESFHESREDHETKNVLAENVEIPHGGFFGSHEADTSRLSRLPHKRSNFPLSAQVFIDAIKKNRSCQRFIREKMIEIEKKIEDNKKLMNRVKVLKDFQLSCKKRTGQALSQKRDPRVLLISARKPHASNSPKMNDKKSSAMHYGPAENPQAANYRMVLERLPLSSDQKKWSKNERENLGKGIIQQFQKMLFHITTDQFSGSDGSSGNANDYKNIVASINDIEITPEKIREFVPKVDWDQLASMYVAGHSGAECEARWLNCEDPLINQDRWTSEEDKTLLLVIGEKGIRNWFDIAISLGTNRTPFQCLARYQRSLNPSILNRQWTAEEDAKLRAAVSIFGEGDWQSVASTLERRTGTQCSNRWTKALHPVRKGGFTAEEDKSLTVTVMLFGRKWNRIAQFVPGRTQAQCRDRYVNCLDPSLKWGEWTEEEDSNLIAAIAKYGCCWSKVAQDVPPRTDCQCRKRWMALFPNQVPLLQEARKIIRATTVSNFVDRESERSALCLDVFQPSQLICSTSEPDNNSSPRKQRKRSSSRLRSKEHNKEAQVCTDAISTEPHSVENNLIEPDQESKSCLLPPENPQSGTRNDSMKTIGQKSTADKKRSTRKLHSRRKGGAAESSEHDQSAEFHGRSTLTKTANGSEYQEDHISTLTEAEGTENSMSIKTSPKKKNKVDQNPRNIRVAEPSGNQKGNHRKSNPKGERTDEDEMTLACLVWNNSKRRRLNADNSAAHSCISVNGPECLSDVEISCGGNHILSNGEVHGDILSSSLQFDELENLPTPGANEYGQITDVDMENVALRGPVEEQARHG